MGEWNWALIRHDARRALVWLVLVAAVIASLVTLAHAQGFQRSYGDGWERFDRQAGETGDYASDWCEDENGRMWERRRLTQVQAGMRPRVCDVPGWRQLRRGP